jgi:cephalosporin-C deacetylase-like acetyl esterase
MIIKYKIFNKSATKAFLQIRGSLSDVENKIQQGFQKNISLEAHQTQTFTFEAQPKQAGLYRIYFRVVQVSTTLCTNSTFLGYALEDLDVPLTRKSDFEDFWDNTLDELDAIKPNYKITKQAILSNANYSVYLVEMMSLDNFLIKGWYRVPVGKRNLPVVLQLPSLGGSFYDIRSLNEQPKHGVPLDFALFSLNIRGHGNSKGNIDVGTTFNHYIVEGLESKETYIYRGAVADCIRAIDFLMTRTELDKKKIVVEGASQGGALSLITAGLDNRIALCCPDVPFLSDIDGLMKTTYWVKDELNYFTKTQKNQSIWNAMQTLTYFDTKNFADQIRASVFMGVGLQDWTCPASTCMAAFNKIICEKNYLIYPYGKHEGGGALHRKRKFEWIRQELGM